MKLINFNIADDNIALFFDKQYLDIHNNFDFMGFKNDELTKSVKLKWIRSHEDWSKEDICGFELIFNNVNYFKVRERQNDLPSTEDSSLCFIGFLQQDMRDDFDSFVEMDKVNDSHDLIINFMSEQAFIINSDTVDFLELKEEILCANR